MLSDVLKYKKAVMCLMEKMYALDKLHSYMSCSALGHEFNDNQLTICIKQGTCK